MDEQVVGRRERKKRATRAALSAAALRLSVEHGVGNVTVEQIAEAADVSLRTFFNYFSSKEEAVVAGDVATTESVVAAFRSRPADEPVIESLRHALHTVARGYASRDHAARLRAMRQDPTLLPHLLAAFAERERALSTAIAERVGADPDHDLYPTVVAAITMTGLRVAVQHWLNGPEGATEQLPLIDLVDQVIDQFAAGLTAPLSLTRR